MAPQKTNFKSYESATRLLAAVIATSNPKLNFNDIAKHMGGDNTGSAIDHRLRPIKQLAKLQVQCVERGSDPGDLPIDKGEIQKLFGESTPDGLEFQFRSIKKLGIAQKAAVEKGEDPSKLVVGNAGTGTPRANRVSTASTPGSRKRAAAAKTPTSKRVQSKKTAAGLSDDESNDEDYDAKDVETPTHKKPKIEVQNTAATPTPRKTASHGNAGSSFASNHTVTNNINVAESFASAVGPPSTTSSLFGDGSRPSTSFTIPPPRNNVSSAFRDDDDDLVEIDSSQFSQSQTQSFSRKPVPKKEPEEQWQSSTTDLYSSRHDSNHGSSYTNSFVSAPQANQSFYGDFELDDDEV